MRYPKINSLYKRDEVTKKFIDGCYADPIFDIVKYWGVEEKIDGTNIRLIINQEDGNISCQLKGRNEDSMMPQSITKFMDDNIVHRIPELLQFMNAKGKVVLFGEGYGPKIQNGGNYRNDVGFILFDVWGGNRWSTREEVKAIANVLSLPVPHEYGIMTLEEILFLVSSKPNSPTAIKPMEFEGVICRSEPLLRDNYTGDPVMFKLKCKDI
jgi:hypothetical protein